MKIYKPNPKVKGDKEAFDKLDKAIKKAIKRDPKLRADYEEEINKHKQYKCRGCKKTFSGEEIQFEDMPDNFHVVGLEGNQKLEKCPHCGDIAFFGFINVEGDE